MIKKYCVNGLLFVGTLFVCFLLLELGARYITKDKKENAALYYTNISEINGQGYRDSDIETLDTKQPIALVIGDSFCFGQGVKVNQRFTEQLEKLLTHATKAWQFYVACKRGNDIKDTYRDLSNILSKLPRVDKVIYLYVLNDPILTKDLMVQQDYINDLMHIRSKNFSKLSFHFIEDSAFLNLAQQILVTPSVIKKTEQWYHDIHFNNPNWQKTVDTFEKMQQLTAQQGLPEPLLVIFPLMHKLDNYPFKDIHRYIKQLSLRFGFQCVDLLPPFEGLVAQALWVSETDFHPNEVAHALAAEYLFNHIEWNGKNN